MRTSDERNQLLRRGRRLEAFTVFWTMAESIIGVVLGILAGSVALIGFGMDSFIEMSSGLVLLWRLRSRHDGALAEQAEMTALRLVGLSLVALVAYILYDSIRALLGHEPPEASVAGIVLAILALVVMPALARAKRRLAVAINSRALQVDSLQATICTYLAALLLGGLLLNVLFGWWWADPVAALAMTPFIAKEGIEAFKGERFGSETDRAGN